jgi:hypothetical protein
MHDLLSVLKERNHIWNNIELKLLVCCKNGKYVFFFSISDKNILQTCHVIYDVQCAYLHEKKNHVIKLWDKQWKLLASQSAIRREICSCWPFMVTSFIDKLENFPMLPKDCKPFIVRTVGGFENRLFSKIVLFPKEEVDNFPLKYFSLGKFPVWVITM